MQPLIAFHRWVEVFFTVVVMTSVIGWGMYRLLQRTEDPRLLVVKWILTVLVGGWLIWQTEAFSNTAASWYHVVVALIGGLVLTAIWRQNIASIVAKPFTALYDGGNVEIEPQPYYSVAEAKRKLGKYTEAIAEIRRQLAKFPTDLTGQMMLAEIQAQDLNDLPGAEVTIHRLCDQPGHAPRNVTHALSTLADWHLKYALDREAARQDLQQIVERFPDTDLSLAAEQRIAHLASMEKMLAPHDRRVYAVPEGIKNLGLRDRRPLAELAQADTDGVAADYVKQLEQFPLDFEVREKLALIYADHYRRLDLATDQLEQMIDATGQPAKKITHWLNLLADLQVRHGADYATVQATLERIPDRYPHTPAAEMARTRLSHLKLEFKGKEKTAGVKMGTYEQNIGLKQGGVRRY